MNPILSKALESVRKLFGTGGQPTPSPATLPAPHWSVKPFIYQINTRVWLTTLSRRFGQSITLANVPEAVIDELAALHINAVWMMGVWTRSKAVRDSALNYKHEYQPVLPDLTDADVIGSAYAIGAYAVDPAAGGRDGLAKFRQQLARRGLKLILDYVPNHVATDHPATVNQLELFVHTNAEGNAKYPGMFYPVKDKDGHTHYIAHGRDPYFPSWIDTAQLNAFHPAMREWTRQTLLDIAEQCDGVRCDMAMLLTNEVFARTWGAHVKERAPQTDFWPDILPAIRAQHPEFQFIAEVYWNMDFMLQQQGFNFTYDKTLYDRLFEAKIDELRTHLLADVRFLRHTVHFIENHDEPRAASAYGIEKSHALAPLICTVPGAVLLHDGQLEGRRVKLPVQINRQPDEPLDANLHTFYKRVLAEAVHPVYAEGEWHLFTPIGATVLAYGYRLNGHYRLVVVNLHPHDTQATIDLTAWGTHWSATDTLNGLRAITNSGHLTLHVARYTALMMHLTPQPEHHKAPRERQGAHG